MTFRVQNNVSQGHIFQEQSSRQIRRYQMIDDYSHLIGEGIVEMNAGNNYPVIQPITCFVSLHFTATTERFQLCNLFD